MSVQMGIGGGGTGGKRSLALVHKTKLQLVFRNDI